jgi:ubiquinone/menaquinone biosynthesis C-methylase UbiE
MPIPDWFLPELTFAGDEHLDTEYVRTYEEKAGADPDSVLTLLRDHGLNETHTLVDLGAGTGKFAFAAAPYCKRVVAVDVSPAMVNVMQDKVHQLGINNVEAIQAGFLSYAHTGEAADFVYTRHALHHLPDFWKVMALQRINEFMKTGGMLYVRDLFYAFEPDEATTMLERWFGNAPDTPDKGWTRAELETHVREEHSTFHWLFETMLVHTGFEIQSVEHSESRVHSAYVCVKQ